MQQDDLYQTTSRKSPAAFATDFEKVLNSRGFIVNNKAGMDMASAFNSHGASTPEGFDLHMIQVCKPEKAAKSLSANPERAVLMPKFVMAFTGNEQTEIRFMQYNAADIWSIVDDAMFPVALTETFTTIKEMIEAAR